MFDPVDFFDEEMEYRAVTSQLSQMQAVSERLCAVSSLLSSVCMLIVLMTNADPEGPKFREVLRV